MSRTVPSFRLVLEEEKAEWKPFRNALNNKKDRRDFDDMFDIPRSYLRACSNAVSLVPIHPIFTSIPFHHYKELMETKAKINQQMTGKEADEKEEEEQTTTTTFEGNEYVTSTRTLDSYFL